MKNKTKCKILGKSWNVIFADEKDNAYLSNYEGYTDRTSRKIVIKNQFKNEKFKLENPMSIIKTTIRHELIHAFLFESWLAYCSNDIEAWATNEEMIDWFAYHLDDILETAKLLDNYILSKK